MGLPYISTIGLFIVFWYNCSYTFLLGQSITSLRLGRISIGIFYLCLPKIIQRYNIAPILAHIVGILYILGKGSWLGFCLLLSMLLLFYLMSWGLLAVRTQDLVDFTEPFGYLAGWLAVLPFVPKAAPLSYQSTWSSDLSHCPMVTNRCIVDPH